jgi:hypothetical protein
MSHVLLKITVYFQRLQMIVGSSERHNRNYGAAVNPYSAALARLVIYSDWFIVTVGRLHSPACSGSAEKSFVGLFHASLRQMGKLTSTCSPEGDDHAA